MSLELATAAESATRAGSQTSERYRGSFELSRFALGDGQELIYSPLTRAAKTLSAPYIRLLEGCRTFATLDEHAARFCREVYHGPEQAADARRQLVELAQAGFLLPQSELLASCRPSAFLPAPRLKVLGVPTRNRTRSLRRCLSSHIANTRQHGRTFDCIVVDDSDDPCIRRANLQMLQALKADHQGGIAYAGPEEKARFAEALIQHSGLPPEDVRFALLNEEGYPLTTGASRNALLLHAVGEALLQVDDDTVCQLAPAPGAQGNLSFSSDYDPTEFWFPAEDEPLPSAGPREPDFLAIHEELLGKGLGDCLAGLGAGSEVDLSRVGASFFRRSESFGGRVLVTAAGVMGDSGMGSPSYFLSLEGPTRSRLLRSESTYRRALARQQVLRAVTRRTVSHGGFCMALNLGLDNRELLPPFTPVQRNQDGVFAALLRGCFEGSYFGYLPWMLLHHAPAVRRLSPEDFWRRAAQVTSGQILEALVSTFHPGPKKADARNSLRALGCSLEDWGTAAPADFEELVRLLLWQQTSRKAAQLENQLRETQGQPNFWADDVRRLLSTWRQALPDRRLVVPADLVPHFGNESSERFQRLVRRFGRLLQVWPDMIVAAKELRDGGRRLAVEVCGA